MLDHVQFTLIHGPNIPGSYVILFFTASDLLSPPDLSTTECHFCFDPAASFFLKVLVIAFYSFQVTYWTPSHLGGSSSGVISFFLLYCSWGSHGKKNSSGLPFLLPVDHILPKLFIITHLSWVALQGMSHSFIELQKPHYHDKTMIHEGALLPYEIIYSQVPDIKIPTFVEDHYSIYHIA